MLKRLTLVSIYLFVLNCTSTSKLAQDPVFESFGVVYSDIDLKQVSGYSLLIVEPYFYTREDILELQSRGIKVLAYLSLGEVNESRRYFEEFRSIGLLGKNQDHGSHFIDLKSKRIKEKFINQIVPELLSYGYDGLFLDTIDAVAPYTVRTNMEQDMVDLISGIRSMSQGKILVQNAGLFILDKTSEYVNAVAIEDIASGYDFDTNEYKIKSDEEFNERLNLVDSMHYQFQIPFLIIDFEPNDTKNEILYSRLRASGYPFFISNIGFDGLPNVVGNSKLKKGA
jgi:hypothetical protein